MDIRECAWCGKAIYGDDYYVGTGGYYHKDCQPPVWAGGNDTPSYVEAGRGGIGGSGEVIVMPSGDFSDIGLLKAENARLKESLRKIHNYIANPEHHDMLKHILDIDKMVLKALYGEGNGE